MKVYIVFDACISENDRTYDDVVKVFADEGDAAELVFSKPTYWFEEFDVH